MRNTFTLLTDAQWQVIEKLIPNQRKGKVCLRSVINGIRWLNHTGSQWREMRSDFPCWQTIYYYFSQWAKNGSLTLMMNQLVKTKRILQNRNELASRAAIDSQSVRKGLFCSLDTGIDGGKCVNAGPPVRAQTSFIG